MSTAQDWIYYKLYLGSKAECADAVLVDFCQRMMANPLLEKWFYLRFLDEQGFHIRLRALAHEGQRGAAEQTLREDCLKVLDQLHEFLPSTYQAMVSLPDYAMPASPVSDARVFFEADVYQRETDKYGSEEAVAVAEDLFHISSELAYHILDDEAQGHYSRKTLAPCLMHAAQQAFPSPEFDDYWRQISLYWLGGESPAANDWRQRFLRKAEELKAGGYSIITPDDQLPPQAQAVMTRWRAVLAQTAQRLAQLSSPVARADVLSLNFSHLMMNRLGIATLEESYLACLLEATEVMA